MHRHHRDVTPARVLVTGATGFLGSRLTRRLVEDGYAVRALVRMRSDLRMLKNLGVDIAFGDLGDGPSVDASVDGIDIVVHAGAGTSGSAKDSETATILGTRNVLEACRKHAVRKLVYISSCNVYEVAGYADNQVVTEEAQLERFPMRRGHYTAAKLQAEALVTEAMTRDCCPTVVLRPGTLFGPGAEIFTAMMGVSFARRLFLVFGDGQSELPLVHVDNAVDAIVECMRNRAADGQVFNVVDPGLVTRKAYVERIIRPLHPGAMVIYCPMPLLRGLTWVQEKLLSALGKRPFLTAYRLGSSQKGVKYDTSSIERAIGWRPRISFEQAAEQLVALKERAAGSGAPSVAP
jgi:nucleoside-diphosphate-sugar epimerase